MMRALRFRVGGKLAQFRRFYTNSSSLTYPIPPPTAVRGLLGAALGLGPEYAEFLKDHRFGIRPAGPWRHLMQTVNHLFVKNQGGRLDTENLAGGKHTQIPVQFVAPKPPAERVVYEILVVGPELETLRDALLRPAYPLSLGPAYALASLEALDEVAGKVDEGHAGPILGAFYLEALDRLRGPGGVRVLHDRFPIRLDQERRPLVVKDLGLEAEGRPLTLDYRGPVFKSEAGVWALVG